MVRVCIQVDCGEDDGRTLSVMAESLLCALELAQEQNPGCALNVVFPLDPDTFFVRKDAERLEAEAVA